MNKQPNGYRLYVFPKTLENKMKQTKIDTEITLIQYLQYLKTYLLIFKNIPKVNRKAMISN